MKRLLTSSFGLGWLPVAPGTWGSLPPMIIFALSCHFGATSIVTAIIMAVIILAASVVCVKLAPAAIKETGKNDPGEVVVDEVAGQAVTFLAVIFFNVENFSAAMLGFLLFRIFDISKPWPIRKLEKFPEGWGILADDLLAGVYAGIVLLIFTVYLYPYLPWS
jgi:phosphatidylglycerophosphatase A